MTISTTAPLLPSPCQPLHFHIVLLPAAATTLPTPWLGIRPWKVLDLAGAALEGLAEEEELDLCADVSTLSYHLRKAAVRLTVVD
jgi:hypothetical protein